MYFVLQHRSFNCAYHYLQPEPKTINFDNALISEHFRRLWDVLLPIITIAFLVTVSRYIEKQRAFWPNWKQIVFLVSALRDSKEQDRHNKHDCQIVRELCHRRNHSASSRVIMRKSKNVNS